MVVECRGQWIPALLCEDNMMMFAEEEGSVSEGSLSEGIHLMY